MTISNTNQIVWKWESKPFGEDEPNENPDNDNNTFTLNLRFPGQYFDKESGFSYNINRYYNPKLGRYMQSDPIGLEGGENSFVYVGGNPLARVDERGEFFSRPKAPALGCMLSGTLNRLEKISQQAHTP